MDMAGYRELYGAGHWPLNWNENQFDIVLSSPQETGERVNIVRKTPPIPGYYLNDYVTSAEKGSGDNAYVYLPVGDIFGKITGTIPRGEKEFKVSAAMHNPPYFLIDTLRNFLISNGISINEKSAVMINQDPAAFKLKMTGKVLYTHYSPYLDSIICWFLKKSINLYGEALIKTFAYEKQGFGSTDSGIVIIKKFWKQKGIDEDELNMRDGSGLSPLNRVTTHAQVEILKYAKTKSWFPYFYNALPEYNGMKMKSGTISDVKGFCGYQKAGDGNEYIFSFLVNNYNGTASGVVNKMYKVLDLLK
ncbi:MAG: D-alanyl-D-alanine carboxypeptidase [Bacteroidota bacterium]